MPAKFRHAFGKGFGQATGTAIFEAVNRLPERRCVQAGRQNTIQEG